MDLPLEIPLSGSVLELDLGCGKGSFLVGMAALYPQHYFVGVERQTGRVLKTNKKIHRLGITNAIVLSGQILENLAAFPEQSVDRIHVLFPDPWPKRRHHIRRLFQNIFLDKVYLILKDDGRLRFVTDDEAYFLWAKKIAEKDHRFEIIEDEEREYVKTDFQSIFESLNKKIYYLVLRKRD